MCARLSRQGTDLGRNDVKGVDGTGKAGGTGGDGGIGVCGRSEECWMEVACITNGTGLKAKEIYNVEEDNWGEPIFLMCFPLNFKNVLLYKQSHLSTTKNVLPLCTQQN